MLDLLDSMAETTKYRSRIDDIFSIFLHVDVDLRSFTFSGCPHYPRRNISCNFNSSTTYLSNPASADEQNENN